MDTLISLNQHKREHSWNNSGLSEAMILFLGVGIGTSCHGLCWKELHLESKCFQGNTSNLRWWVGGLQPWTHMHTYLDSRTVASYPQGSVTARKAPVQNMKAPKQVGPTVGHRREPLSQSPCSRKKTYFGVVRRSGHAMMSLFYVKPPGSRKRL